MATDDGPEIYYETTDGISIVPCTILQAQLWLAQGYLARCSRFALSENEMRRSEFRTLEELMQQNGRELPFAECELDENMKKEQEDELKRLHKEMIEINQRKENAQQKLLEISERSNKVQTELERLSQIAPIRNNRSTQTVVALNGVINGGAATNSPATRRITPRPGVDPFALLNSCARAKRMLHEYSVSGSFKQLRGRFDRCDKQHLVQLARDIFPWNTVKMCTLCRVKLTSSTSFLEHICSVKHIAEMHGSVCADAFDFWSYVLERATVPEKSSVPKTNSAVVSKSQPASNNKEQQPKRSVQGADAIHPPNLPVLSVLRRLEKVDRICPNPKDELSKIFNVFKTCDKKKLDNDPNTMGLFTKPLLCLICNRCAIDKASNFITHITGKGHVEMVETESCLVSQNTIDFWMRAVRKASNFDATTAKASSKSENHIETKNSEKQDEDQEEVLINGIKAITIGETNKGDEEIQANSTSSMDWYDGWRVGDRCEWKGETATVRWIGTLKIQDEVCAGLEFDNPVGQGTGMYQGTELFTTKSDHAGFVKLFEIMKMKNKAVSIAEHEGWKLGRRCIWKNESATLRWMGKLEGHTGVYAGLAFDEAVGEGTGMYKGMELFRTSNNHAGFVLLSSVSPL